MLGGDAGGEETGLGQAELLTQPVGVAPFGAESGEPGVLEGISDGLERLQCAASRLPVIKGCFRVGSQSGWGGGGGEGGRGRGRDEAGGGAGG